MISYFKMGVLNEKRCKKMSDNTERKTYLGDLPINEEYKQTPNSNRPTGIWYSKDDILYRSQKYL